MKCKHAPGPWFNCEYNRTIVAPERVKELGKSFNIAKYPSRQGKYPISHEEHKANAQLIAAAPNLLQVLHSLFIESVHYRNTGIGKEFLNKAIDKAEEVLIKAGKS